MVTTRYLTKSRFILATECPTKLYYSGKRDYVDRRQDDSFLKALADGGFQVGRLAQTMHPEGVAVDEKEHAQALARTHELLAQENVTVFEAALAFEGLFVRVDILKKRGNEYELIEVKAKSYGADNGDLRGKYGGIDANFKPYLLDVAFQRFVVERALPGARIRAQLMLVNKSSVATMDGLHQQFRIRRDAGRTEVDVVNVNGVADIGAPILTTLNVDSQVDQLLAEHLPVSPGVDLPFDEAVRAFAAAYADDRRLDPNPSKACGQCEFRAARWPEAGELRSGFHECWASAFGWQPADFDGATVLDVFDLRTKDELIRQGVLKAALLQPEDLKFKGEAPGGEGLTTRHRQWYVGHRDWPGGGDFYFDAEGIRRAMAEWRYPLHFIDFETSMAAIPFTKGKRPYQMTAFQFSHHEMQADGTVRHRDQFLFAEPGTDPTVPFVRALKAALQGDEGTIFRWSHHENTVLCALREELLASANPPPDRDELIAFIDRITTREKVPGPRDMIDLCDLSGKFFFHPETHGSASLKKVLPTVLSCSTTLRELYGAATYGANVSQNWTEPTAWWQWKDGSVVDPYALLPALFEDFPTDEVESLAESLPERLREGGAAMAAYARLQAEDLAPAARAAIERGLLRYCELDTLAMVMVVQAWRGWIEAGTRPRLAWSRPPDDRSGAVPET